MADIKPFSDSEYKSLGKLMSLLKKEAIISYGDKIANIFTQAELVDFNNEHINIVLTWGTGEGAKHVGESTTEKIKITREDMEVTHRITEKEEKYLADQPKNMRELVEEIYENCKDNEEFIQDVKTKTAGEFAIDNHHGFGTNIRNRCGFWGGNTPVYRELRALGVKHADDMSGRVLRELHHYAKDKIENNNQ